MRGSLLVIFSALAAACAPASESGDADTEEHAMTLARRVIIVDGHVDLPYRLHAKARSAEVPPPDGLAEDVTTRTESGDFDYPRARDGGLDAPFMSIYVPARLEESGGAKALADELIDLVESIAARAPDKFAVTTSVDEVRANHRNGKISLLMGMENGSPLEGSLQNLSHFHERGIRYITLAHSKDNHICDSSFDDRKTWGGLSPFGREVVAEMNRLGVMVDVSHLSDDATGQVLDLTRAPVIASHSSCRHFTPGFERNMSDELMRRLAENGGVIMINFGSAFLLSEICEKSMAGWKHVREWAEEQGLDPDDPLVAEYRRAYFADNHSGYADVSDVADHIDHAVEVAGIDHVGLGSDFDGVGDSLPTGLKDVSDYPNLIRVLQTRGYTDEQIEKICSGNVLRVMGEVERVSRVLGRSE